MTHQPERIDILETITEKKWTHAVFVTYGFDPHFFEAQIMRPMLSSARNVVVLADGRQLRQTIDRVLGNNTDSPPLHGYNQQYVVTPIENGGGAAHAKMILLYRTKPALAYLLVGSGNLQINGYTSGGEQFTLYRWSLGDYKLQTVSPFQEAFSFLRALGRSDRITREAYRQIAKIGRAVPSFLADRVPTDPPYPPSLYHNISQPLLDQFVAALAGDVVLELTVMAPFYDHAGGALRQMIDDIAPTHLRVIVQNGGTSVDKAVLQEVLTTAVPERHTVLTATLADRPTTYLHSKIYVAKLADRVVCLQGSPNLSGRALCLTGHHSHGNIELANLLILPLAAYDTLFAPLTLTPIESWDDSVLDLHLWGNTGEADGKAAVPPIRLLDVNLSRRRNKANIRLQEPLPPYSELHVLNQQVVIETDRVTYHEEDLILEFNLPPAFVSAHQSFYFTLSLTAAETGAVWISNGVVPYQLDQLRDMEKERVLPATDKVGHAFLADDDHFELIEAYETYLSHVPVSRPSSDRDLPLTLSGNASLTQRVSPSAQVETSGEVFGYRDIDSIYRRRSSLFRVTADHKKITTAVGRGGDISFLSPLERMLYTLLHYSEPAASTESQPKTDRGFEVTIQLKGDGDSDDAGQTAEAERLAHVARQTKRLIRLTRKLIKRYLADYDNLDHLAIIGPWGITYHFILYHHLLWHLIKREDSSRHLPFFFDSLTQIWGAYWGGRDQEGSGYLDTLDQLHMEPMHELHGQFHIDAYVLASMVWLRQQYDGDSLQIRALQTAFRQLVTADVSVLTEETILRLGILLESPMIERQIGSLWETGHMVTRYCDEFLTSEFVHILNKRFSVYCQIERPTDRKRATKRLVIPSADVMRTEEEAIELMAEWLAYEPNWDLYQIDIYVRNRSLRTFAYSQIDGSGYLMLNKDKGPDHEEYYETDEAIQPKKLIVVDRITGIKETIELLVN